MAVTARMYGQFLIKALNKEVTLGNGATGIKAMLCTSAYVPDQDAHVYKSSITNEVTGTGYTVGGNPLNNVSVTYTSATNTIKVDADDTTWANSTITARYCILYDSTQTLDSAKALIAYVDFGADMSSSAGNFTITWDTAGIFTISTT